MLFVVAFFFFCLPDLFPGPGLTITADSNQWPMMINSLSHVINSTFNERLFLKTVARTTNVWGGSGCMYIEGIYTQKQIFYPCHPIHIALNSFLEISILI